MEKTNKAVRLIRITIYVIVLIAIYNILMVGIAKVLTKDGRPILNYNMYIITTDSMKPQINSGDIVLTHKVKQENISMGDIITFIKQEELITHRIVEINEEEGNINYITKGDNNNLQDKQSVGYNEIIGKVILRIPYIGKIALFIQNNLYIATLLMIIATIYMNVKRIETKNKLRREKKRKADENFQENH